MPADRRAKVAAIASSRSRVPHVEDARQAETCVEICPHVQKKCQHEDVKEFN